MKYQHIPQHPSVIKYFKGAFNLRSLVPIFTFVWDVQIKFEYFRNLGNDSKISDKHLPQNFLILLLLLGKYNFSFVACHSLKFTCCLLLVVKSLLTCFKICWLLVPKFQSLLAAEVARCKNSLVTRCRSCSL